MRIRSIKPEFWRSDDIAALSIADRLLFIGLWSYVDDSGIGVDKLANITADLFAPDLVLNPPEVFGRVTGGLQRLAERGLVIRYEAAGQPFLYITNWPKHQRIDKPSRRRYPLPDLDEHGNPVALQEPSKSPPVKVAPGAVEQWSSGAVELPSPDPAAPSQADDRFEEFWDTYGKKTGRKKSKIKWDSLLRHKTTTAEVLISAARDYTAQQRVLGRFPEHTKDPLTWLNGEHWNDDIPDAQSLQSPEAQEATDLWNHFRQERSA